MIRCKIAGLLMVCGLVACSRAAPPEVNPLMEPVKALDQARAVESQLIEQAEQRKRMLEAAEK